MTVKELLTNAAVQDRLSDSLETGYNTNELIAYLNDAMNFVWHVLIVRGYYEVVNDITLTEQKTAIPNDWYKVSNQAPIIPRNGFIECYGTLPMDIRYYKSPPMLETEDDEIPLQNEGLLDLITQILIVLAMSNHGFDMQMESDFAQAIANLVG